MTPQQLLIPRYKVISGYPGSPFMVPQILKCRLSTNDQKTMLYPAGTIYPESEGVCIKLTEAMKYPSIFQLLKWYERREIGDMPEFVKCTKRVHTGIIEAGMVFKIIEWRFADFGIAENIDMPIILGNNCFDIATLEQYTTFINSQQKDKI